VAASTYTADRWQYESTLTAVADVFKTADAPTPAQAGLYTQHCFHVDVTTADAAVGATDLVNIVHYIEGNNCKQLGFGFTGAKTITISFWVKSTKTGTFCVNLRNGGGTRSYVAEYTISSSDVWERKVVTITGDTTGTWTTDNSIGIQVRWILMCGSTFQTGAGVWTAGSFFASAAQANAMDNTANNFKLALCQLEVGTSATPFERTSINLDLLKCQRYYAKSFAQGTTPAQNLGAGTGETRYPSTATGAALAISQTIFFPVTMRASPTVTFFNPQAANGEVRNLTDGADCSASVAGSVHPSGFHVSTTANAGSAVGEQLALHWTASAEL
jgi:hypothetical protein